MARHKNQNMPHAWGAGDPLIEKRKKEASQTRLKLLHEFRQSHYASQNNKKKQ